MTTLFVSDLHLEAGHPACQGRFLDFLRTRAVGADALYVLGDLFEVWLGDDAAPEHTGAVMTALRELVEQGTHVYVMHGNRDFLLGSDFEAASGCRIVPDPSIVSLDSGRALLMHGDTLCTDDLDYQQFRAQVRDPAAQRQFLALPVAQRQELARRFRDASREHTRAKPDAIMDVNQAEVERVMREHGVELLIHGHTHRPTVHRFELDGRPVRRIVLGDWDDGRGSVLVADAEGERLSEI